MLESHTNVKLGSDTNEQPQYRNQELSNVTVSWDQRLTQLQWEMRKITWIYSFWWVLKSGVRQISRRENGKQSLSGKQGSPGQKSIFREKERGKRHCTDTHQSIRPNSEGSRGMSHYLAALKYMRRSQSLTPGIQTSSSCWVTASPSGEGNGCKSGSLACKTGIEKSPPR